MKIHVVFESAQGSLVAGLVDYPSLESLAVDLNRRELRCLTVEDPETGQVTLVNTAVYAKVYERS